jgi:hypothetical protein
MSIIIQLVKAFFPIDYSICFCLGDRRGREAEECMRDGMRSDATSPSATRGSSPCQRRLWAGAPSGNARIFTPISRGATAFMKNLALFFLFSK